MTVECPSCETAFPVDPAKVPSGGIHARCSVCRRVFLVEKPAEEVREPEEPSVVEKAPAPEAPEDLEEWEAPREEESPVSESEAGAVAPPAEVEPEEEAEEEDEDRDAFFGDGPLPGTEREEDAVEASLPQTEDPAVEAPAVEEDEAEEEEWSPFGDLEGDEPVSVEPEPAGTDVETVEAPAEEPPSPPAFGQRSPEDKAKRLARVLVSDMITYNPALYENALKGGTLKEDFEEEVERSWEEYVEQVGEELAESTSYFTDALNEILAKGEEVF